MKKLALLLAWMAVVPCVTYAQDDDVYFIPSEDVTPVDDHASSYTPLTVDAADEAADNAGADYYSDSQIDAYNRRGNGTDTVQYGDYEADTSAQTEGSMTERLIRFHSPEINVYLLGPHVGLGRLVRPLLAPALLASSAAATSRRSGPEAV